MLVRVNPDNPQERVLKQVVDCLKQDGVIIYPTDTVYALGCSMASRKGLERVCQIKGVTPEKEQFSIICSDLSAMAEYALPVSTPIYKLMRRALPGPYTFILKASKHVPAHFRIPRKTIGIRVVNHLIPTEIVRLLEAPLVTTSLRHEDNILEYRTDPELIHERYKKQVDYVVDGGYGGNVASTVLDCSEAEIEEEVVVVREGLGTLDAIFS
jgi:tRNA threonylcarbamoyl adenosine modification protein (Sua5/YciO/YrdC/YwlC family)